MKTFQCDHCGALVFFENVSCIQCGHSLGFLPDIMDMAALEPDDDQRWKSLAPASRGKLYRACANGARFSVCNWYVPAEEPEEFCAACRLNALVPDVSLPQNRAFWHKIEIAKRRLIYTLRQLSLQTEGYPARMWPRLQFRFLAEWPDTPPVMSGHESGVITLNIIEADDVERERRRIQLHEPQRTLAGHLRHESGHYYWDALVPNSPWHERFRSLFGDEQTDYLGALKTYYTDGPSPDWASRCVSAYASVHPWEDWAETWAHYLHMVDSVETAASFGISLHSPHTSATTAQETPFGALADRSFAKMLDCWFPLTCALNALNRGAGIPDLYPFVLPGPAVEKLRFVHDIVLQQQRGAGSALNNPAPAFREAS